MTEKRKYNRKTPEPSPVNDPMVQYGNQPPSFEQVWLLFQETNRQFKESEKLLTEKFQETNRQFKESEKFLTEKFQETDRQFKETGKQFKETDKKIKELSELFTSHWGKLVESLVNGAVLRLLNEAGIKVYYTTERATGCVGGENFEFDILAHNGDQIVAIEVKTTLKPSDVKAWLKKLGKFKTYLPGYANKQVMGGVAFLRADAGSETQALNAGLFVFKALNDSAVLLNPPGFVPREF
jgi:hypothetical protein